MVLADVFGEGCGGDWEGQGGETDRKGLHGCPSPIGEAEVQECKLPAGRLM